MPRITISLSKEDDRLLRNKAKENFRSVSGEVSYLLHKVYNSKNTIPDIPKMENVRM